MKRQWIPLLLVFVVGPYLGAQSTAQTSSVNSEHQANTPQDHSMHEGHHSHAVSGINMPRDENPAKLLADKKESEFNHHLAGLFVVLGGLFILAQGRLTDRWAWTKYIWPATFLLSGLFVLVWSDTELWPFGNTSWLSRLQSDREVLQHKTFAVLLLALGWIEWQRVKGTLSAGWSGLVFPVLAIGGSILLLFHQHEGGMHGPDHMQLMARIQSEHMLYAVVGIGLGIAKALAELKTRNQIIFARSWPLLMAALGFLLMFYRE